MTHFIIFDIISYWMRVSSIINKKHIINNILVLYYYFNTFKHHQTIVRGFITQNKHI